MAASTAQRPLKLSQIGGYLKRHMKKTWSRGVFFGVYMFWPWVI
jgi:hypothetical protein